MTVHPRVFISCYKADAAHPDTQFAQRLIADLSASGVIVATSASNNGHNDTIQRLNQTLKHCQWLVLVQTPASLASPQVRAEVDTALSMAAQGKLRGALAIVGAPIDPRAIPFAWANLRTFDAVQNYQQALMAVEAALELGRADAATVMFGSGTQYAPAGQYGMPAQGGAWPGPPPVDHTNLPTLISQSGKAQKPARSHALRAFLITLLVILLIVAGAGGFFLARSAIITYNAGALASAVRATTTAQTQNAANAAVRSPLNPYPPGGGALALNNTLFDSSSSGNWDMNGACALKNAAYDVSETAGTGFTYCYDQNTNFSNFVYQAQVKIISGYAAGLIFRANVASNQPKLYYFLISENGSYGLYLVSQVNTVGQELQGGTNTTIIRTGPGQVNVMAVVARDHYLDFYVNLRYLFSATDVSLSSGQIGVFIYDRANAAEAAISLVKVWQL